MYSYIFGKILEIEENYITVDNNNIGYLIYVANPTTYSLNVDAKVYIYTHIREDEYTLYGFNSLEAKKLFLKFLNVKGVGPKMALSLISSSVDAMVNAINNNEIEYLKKFPKVGDKLANQIILDLKGKIVHDSLASSKGNQELVEALLGLGYKKNDIGKVLKQIDLNETIENQIKDALRVLMK